MSNLHTLESLSKLYAEAAKAGGMEVYCVDGTWIKANNGPNLNSDVTAYRPKQTPLVRYAIEFADGTVLPKTFMSGNLAEEHIYYYCKSYSAKVIKLVKEPTK